MRFDEVVSLGYNCEVSFRIEDYFGIINSFPFSWVNWQDKELFLKSLNNLEVILTGEIELLPWGMFKCKKYNIDFHSSNNKKHLFINGKPNDENVKEEIVNLKSKIKHLSNKFEELLKSEKNTLFVIKVRHDGANDIWFLKELYSNMSQRYESKKFTILAVFEEKYLSKELIELETEHLKIRSLKCFAEHNKTDTTGDLKGWHNVFSEFNYSIKRKVNIVKDIKKTIKMVYRY